jgi:hypothetical protein
MPENIIREYIRIVDSVYGVFLDSCQGFSSARSLFEQSQSLTLEKNKKLLAENQSLNSANYNSTIKQFDDSCMIYSKGKKGESDYRILHYCPTQAEYKKRNSPEGDNYRFIGNMTLITIYEYWENSCRNKLALYHRVKQKQIRSQIVGDLRILRNSIVHHMGIALPEVEKCKQFSWYKTNDDIFINEDQMEDIIATIKESKLSLYSIE